MYKKELILQITNKSLQIVLYIQRKMQQKKQRALHGSSKIYIYIYQCSICIKCSCLSSLIFLCNPAEVTVIHNSPFPASNRYFQNFKTLDHLVCFIIKRTELVLPDLLQHQYAICLNKKSCNRSCQTSAICQGFIICIVYLEKI